MKKGKKKKESKDWEILIYIYNFRVCAGEYGLRIKDTRRATKPEPGEVSNARGICKRKKNQPIKMRNLVIQTGAAWEVNIKNCHVVISNPAVTVLPNLLACLHCAFYEWRIFVKKMMKRFDDF